MLTELEVRPVTNPYVMNLFARGKILSEADQIEQIRSMLFNALAEFEQQASNWRFAVDYVNRILIKNRYKMRIYPAGIIPFFQHPVAVVFKLTGEYCLLFELSGLDNGTRELDFPIEANMSNPFFMDLLSGIINKNKEIGNNGLVYNVLTRLNKIGGLQSYGVTLRHNLKLIGQDILVIAENPFGMEFRLPLTPYQDKDIRLNVKCAIDRETKKEIKNIPDVFFIWEVLQDIAKAWPENKSAAELVRLVDDALAVLNIRSVTKRQWSVDRRVSKDCMPIGWVIEDISWDSREQPGSVSLPLIGGKDNTIRFVIAFKGLEEAAAKSIESVYKKESLAGSLKNIFSLKRKTDDTGVTECLKPVTFRKAPRELSRAILKSIQSHLSISYAELTYAIQREMKRKKLEKEYAVDRLRIALEQKGPAIYVTEFASDQTYKFIIERRTDETIENYGLIQVDENDEEVRRFSISKSRPVLK
jgi:hypothetical protein